MLKKLLRKWVEKTGIADEIRAEHEAKVRKEYADMVCIVKGRNITYIHKSEFNEWYLKGWRKKYGPVTIQLKTT